MKKITKYEDVGILKDVEIRYTGPWRSLVVGDEGGLAQAETCCVYVKPQKLCNSCMA